MSEKRTGQSEYLVQAKDIHTSFPFDKKIRVQAVDGVSLEQVRKALKPRLTVVANIGADLFQALLGR